MKVADIRYSQDSVFYQFTDGRKLSDVNDEIASGQMLVSEIDRIRIVPRTDGLYYLHDNRRLLVFIRLYNNGYIEEVPCEIVSTTILAWQFTTYDRWQNWPSTWPR